VPVPRVSSIDLATGVVTTVSRITRGKKLLSLNWIDSLDNYLKSGSAITRSDTVSTKAFHCHLIRCPLVDELIIEWNEPLVGFLVPVL